MKTIKKRRKAKRVVGSAPMPQQQQLRRRRGITELGAEQLAGIPHCPHGPCLLFTDSNERWFSCAVYRSLEGCPLRVTVQPDDTLDEYEEVPTIHSTPLCDYGSARKSFDSLSHWCVKCSNYVGVPHMHPVSGPYSEWTPPTRMLKALQDDRAYWFSGDTHRVLSEVVRRREVDSVLCIGAPSVMEEELGHHLRCFALDYDDRLARFYSPTEFARYSMLVHHFYHTESQAHLRQFFRGAQKLAVVCDPPFGVFTSALMRSLRQLRAMFKEEVAGGGEFEVIVFLPLFVGKHILEDEPTTFSMVDFKVTYDNHKDFAVADKSIVRIFTDIPNRCFVLPAELGYRFCSLCDRYVAEENKHCRQCKACTTKIGPTYAHCRKCQRCVKPNYAHCLRCQKCHLKGRCING